jgi:hypothetical protein
LSRKGKMTDILGLSNRLHLFRDERRPGRERDAVTGKEAIMLLDYRTNVTAP